MCAWKMKEAEWWARWIEWKALPGKCGWRGGRTLWAAAVRAPCIEEVLYFPVRDSQGGIFLRLKLLGCERQKWNDCFWVWCWRQGWNAGCIEEQERKVLDLHWCLKLEKEPGFPLAKTFFFLLHTRVTELTERKLFGEVDRHLSDGDGCPCFGLLSCSKAFDRILNQKLLNIICPHEMRRLCYHGGECWCRQEVKTELWDCL